jgi:hypothetical protein
VVVAIGVKIGAWAVVVLVFDVDVVPFGLLSPRRSIKELYAPSISMKRKEQKARKKKELLTYKDARASAAALVRAPASRLALEQGSPTR